MGDYRIRRCVACRMQCFEYAVGAIEHDSPEQACPRGFWSAYRPPVVVPSAVTPARMVGNAVRAVGRVMAQAATGRKVAVSGEEQARRLAICASCEFFNGSKCAKCGCFVRWKTRLATENCPVGKW